MKEIIINSTTILKYFWNITLKTTQLCKSLTILEQIESCGMHR